MTIRVLSEETINKIAAGEVVERPANAVKELVENSLDARSTVIDIELAGAGRSLIRVRDDGTGMTREDLALAVTRHATSKIRNFDDLTALSTLGFRGEALPSIAAVSRLTIQSQPHSEKTGWELQLAGGKLVKSRAAAASPGTVIEVRELFFNTPARAKFLKSDTTERHRILRIIEEIAIARPDVAFTVVSEGRKTLSAPKAGTLSERIADVLGPEFARALLPLEVTHPSVTIRGFVTRPDESLSHKNSQFFFVNGRPIAPGKVLLHGLYEAYRENLPAGRHPGVVIFIEINPGEIDVNIHPTKREIRFSKEQEIRQLLYRAVRDILSKTPAAPPLPETDMNRKEERPSRVKPRPSAAPAVHETGLPYPDGRAVIPSGVFEPPEERPDIIVGEEAALPYRPLGQAFDMYLVVQSGNELLVVDQHAAAERIRYERYLAEWEKKQIPVQPLLFPATVELPPSRAGLLIENIPLLESAGWEIAAFGANTVRITALPAVLGSDIEARTVLSDIIEALAEEAKLPPAQKTERIIRAACRSSIKAGDFVADSEAKRLLEDLFRCRAPFTCPHGRPTVFKLTRSELERFFGRS